MEKVLEEAKDAECADVVGKDELEEVIDKEVVGVEEVSEEEVEGRVEGKSDMLDILRVEKGSIVRGLVEEQRFDKTLKHCQNLADRHKKGYSWEKNVLMKTVLDDIRWELKLIVIPQTKWKEILDMAHNKKG